MALLQGHLIEMDGMMVGMIRFTKVEIIFHSRKDIEMSEKMNFAFLSFPFLSLYWMEERKGFGIGT